MKLHNALFLVMRGSKGISECKANVRIAGNSFHWCICSGALAKYAQLSMARYRSLLTQSCAKSGVDCVKSC